MVCRNQGNFERLIRVMFGTGLVFCAVANTHTWSVVGGCVGLVLLTTVLLGWCPLSAMLRNNACGSNDAAKTQS